MSKNLNSFLSLGYFLDFKNNDISIDLSNIDKTKYVNVRENELIELGSKLWRESISHNFKSNQKHLVPISGGLDSRAVLAALLEHTEAKNIYTYTFGSANTLDYDIGNHVAKKIGTNHTSFDLTKFIYTQNELEDISRRIQHQTILFHHWPVWHVDKHFKGCTHWSGFFGDPQTGSHLPANESTNIEEAKTKFITKNTYVKSLKISKESNFDSLIQSNCISQNNLTLDEQLDIQNRQTKYVSPLVLMRGYEYKVPFLHQPLMNFMLSIPDVYRVDQNLYKKILLSSFPREFSYKTKSNLGLPLGASKSFVFMKRVQGKILNTLNISSIKGTNYLDFNQKIRTKQDVKDIISDNVMNLRSRDIIDWIDIEEILKNHLSNKGNYADALIALASLEIHLKSGMKF